MRPAIVAYCLAPSWDQRELGRGNVGGTATATDAAANESNERTYMHAWIQMLTIVTCTAGLKQHKRHIMPANYRCQNTPDARNTIFNRKPMCCLCFLL